MNFFSNDYAPIVQRPRMQPFQDAEPTDGSLLFDSLEVVSGMIEERL